MQFNHVLEVRAREGCAPVFGLVARWAPIRRALVGRWGFRSGGQPRAGGSLAPAYGFSSWESPSGLECATGISCCAGLAALWGRAPWEHMGTDGHDVTGLPQENRTAFPLEEGWLFCCVCAGGRYLMFTVFLGCAVRVRPPRRPQRAVPC